MPPGMLPHLSPAARAILDLIRQHDILALSVLIFLEEMGIPLPLPGNFLLVYLGSQAAHGRVNGVQVVAMMTLASAFGSLTLYIIAERLGRPAMLRWGRYLGLEHRRVDRIERWLDRYGSVTIAVGRLLPGLRTPTSAVGGIFGIPLPVFIPFTSLAAFIWTLFWFVLGALVGQRLHLQHFTSGSHLVGTIALAVGLLLILPAIGLITAHRDRQRDAKLRALVDGPDPIQSIEKDERRAGPTPTDREQSAEQAGPRAR